ncbi:MAG: IclR family transcriptional regulator [Oscillospiraceae bacterium]
MDNVSNIRVADKVFSILEYLAGSPEPARLTDISHGLVLSKTTVYRLLSVMQERGYVKKDSRQAYSVGPKLLEIASYRLNNLELQTEAKPFLTALHAALNLTVHLGTLDSMNIIYVEKIYSPTASQGYSKVGYNAPAYCSAIGKSLLACLSGDELGELFYNFKMEQFTKYTITDLGELKKHLRDIRSQGWSRDEQEYQLGRRCIGVPIFDYRGEAVAALSVSGDLEQMSEEKLPMIIHEVKKVASQISVCLGYSGEKQ